MPLNLVMMGTGAFAVPSFSRLIESDHQVVGLVTQPDRTGRGHHRHRCPMKEKAFEHGIDVFQPERANSEASLKRLRQFNADLFVVAAYGQILSADLLGIPRLGAINLHASLLPKYRGAAPVQYAILNGERETGVTIFQIEPKLDAGPILGVETIPILPKETAGELAERLAELAIGLTLRVVDQLASHTTEPITQDSAQVSKAPRLQKSDGLIDWTRSAEQIDWHVRGTQPWPKASTYLRSVGRDLVRVIVLEVESVECPSPKPGKSDPGTIVDSNPGSLIVQTGEGCVEIIRLQPEGKRAMATVDFLCGHSINSGDQFLTPIGLATP